MTFKFQQIVFYFDYATHTTIRQLPNKVSTAMFLGTSDGRASLLKSQDSYAFKRPMEHVFANAEDARAGILRTTIPMLQAIQLAEAEAMASLKALDPACTGTTLVN